MRAAGGPDGQASAQGFVYVTGSAAAAVAASPDRIAVPHVPLAVAIARIARARTGPHPRPAPFYLNEADAAPPADLPPLILDA